MRSAAVTREGTLCAVVDGAVVDADAWSDLLLLLSGACVSSVICDCASCLMGAEAEAELALISTEAECD